MNLGMLLGSSPQHLVIRSQEWDETKGIPQIDEQVFDSNKQLIGRIADIFGPVKKPFISVKLNRTSKLTLDDFTEKKGMSFYTLPGDKKKFNRTKPQGSGKSNRPQRNPKQTQSRRKTSTNKQKPTTNPRTSPSRKQR